MKRRRLGRTNGHRVTADLVDFEGRRWRRGGDWIRVRRRFPILIPRPHRVAFKRMRGTRDWMRGRHRSLALGLHPRWLALWLWNDRPRGRLAWRAREQAIVEFGQRTLEGAHELLRLLFDALQRDAPRCEVGFPLRRFALEDQRERVSLGRRLKEIGELPAD